MVPSPPKKSRTMAVISADTGGNGSSMRPTTRVTCTNAPPTPTRPTSSRPVKTCWSGFGGAHRIAHIADHVPRVGGVAWYADAPGLAAHIDDAPGTDLDHAPPRGLTHEEQPLEVDVQKLVPLLLGKVDRVVVRAESRVVYKNVHLADSLGGPL